MSPDLGRCVQRALDTHPPGYTQDHEIEERSDDTQGFPACTARFDR